MKKLFAIYGDPVAHSRSPLMHNHVFKTFNYDACYSRVHLKNGHEIRESFFALGLRRANVTVPHKEAAFKACDEVRGFAKTVGVVNTLINEDGRLIGYNTDADGFMYAIHAFEQIHSVLILGAGGTAKALAQRFKDDTINVTLLNRSAKRLEFFSALGFTTATWETFTPQPYDLIVNTTSAGLKDEVLPAPEALLLPLLQTARYGADAIYGKITPFLALCAEHGLSYKDGAQMLLGQGVLANRYFTENKFSIEAIEKTMQESFAF